MYFIIFLQPRDIEKLFLSVKSALKPILESQICNVVINLRPLNSGHFMQMAAVC